METCHVLVYSDLFTLSSPSLIDSIMVYSKEWSILKNGLFKRPWCLCLLPKRLTCQLLSSQTRKRSPFSSKKQGIARMRRWAAVGYGGRKRQRLHKPLAILWTLAPQRALYGSQSFPGKRHRHCVNTTLLTKSAWWLRMAKLRCAPFAAVWNCLKLGCLWTSYVQQNIIEYLLKIHV